MKRAVIVGVFSAMLVAGVVIAAQGWTDDQDGDNFSLSNVNTVQVNNLAGVGTTCVEADNAGSLIATGAPCGSGGTDAGISAPAGEVVYGTGSGVTSSPQFKYDTTIDQIQNVFSKATGQNGIKVSNASNNNAAYADYALTNDLGDSFRADVYYGSSTYATADCGPSHLCFATAGGPLSYIDFSPNDLRAFTAQPGLIELPSSDVNAIAIKLDMSGTQDIDKLGGSFFLGTSDANQLGLYTNNTNRVTISSGGAVKVFSLGTAMTKAVSGVLTDAVAGTDYQAPLTACTDYVSVGCQAGATDIGGTNATTTVIGIESGATMRGSLLATAIAAPGTPAAGKGSIYVDSTAKTLTVKNDAGAVTHTVRSQTALTGFFLKSLADNGSLGIAQPAFSDLSGSATCAQLPALTGDVTSSAGTCATAVVAIEDSAEVKGKLNFDFAAAPSAPASGQTCWSDSVNNVIECKDSVSNVSVMPLVFGCGGSKWVNSMAASGVTSCTQPAFTDISGSLACGQTPAFTGSATKASGSCATKVVALDETSGPTQLSIGAIPDGNPDPSLLLRPAGGASVVGVAPRFIGLSKFAISYGVEMAGTVLYGSGSGGWLPIGTATAFAANHIESVVPQAITGVRIIANVPANTISGGAVTFSISQNGGPTSAGGSTTVAGGATGQHDSGYAAISASTSDAFGVVASNSCQFCTGSISAVVTVYLY